MYVFQLSGIFGCPYAYAWKAIIFYSGSFFFFFEPCPERSPNNGTQENFATCSEVSLARFEKEHPNVRASPLKRGARKPRIVGPSYDDIVTSANVFGTCCCCRYGRRENSQTATYVY